MIAGCCKSVAAGLLLQTILHLSCYADTDEAGIIIRNVNLIDGTGRDIQYSVDIGIRDGMIADTRNGASMIDTGNVLGTIEPGKFADMLILGSNPLDDIGNIRDIDLIIQDGKMYEREFFAYKE